jgi:hypothetical protein
MYTATNSCSIIELLAYQKDEEGERLEGSQAPLQSLQAFQEISNKKKKQKSHPRREEVSSYSQSVCKSIVQLKSIKIRIVQGDHQPLQDKRKGIAQVLLTITH